ncbi:YbaN family protein [Marinilactibacillus piezotolerans]|uniref:YbaN family protein n=1 Tax=Marinilactibacillus piezotolerans TaxID=258723 RepID=UPI0009B1062B|nr:YbaN family protein [Marinilactibacillus piezotolerans]
MKRIALVSCGLVSFALGALGALLPVLPTTPFLLLSGYCFAHSSSRFDKWLKKTKLYQVFVADYAETKSIPRNRKWKILLNSYVLMAISIYFAPLPLIKLMLSVLTVGLTIMIWFVIPDRQVDQEANKTEETEHNH